MTLRRLRSHRASHGAALAALCALLLLPALHGVGFTHEIAPAQSASGLPSFHAPADPGAAHGAATCPVCLAMSQARGALPHPSLERAPAPAPTSRAHPAPPAAAGPRSPERTPAAPRAPPASA